MDKIRPNHSHVAVHLLKGLRDHLATDRTILANERTFLAYLRTALTMFIAGATFIRFFDYDWLVWIGWAFIPASVVVMAAGVYSFRRTGKVIAEVVEEQEKRESNSKVGAEDKD